MNLSKSNITEWAEQFLNQELSAKQIASLEKQLADDVQLKEEWASQLSFLKSMRALKERKELRALSSHVAQTYDLPKGHSTRKSILKFWRKYNKVVGVAAAIALVSSYSTYFFATKKSSSSDKTHYISLKRELQTIKNKQAAIKSSIVKEDEIIRVGNQAGTGFALSNDGYIATDYHVVDAADSIYILTAKNHYERASLVTYSEKDDIAILKVNNPDFKFGTEHVPLVLSDKEESLAQEIFCIGYPQVDAQYAEGYISSVSSRDVDQARYKLNMPAYPGQSGSPVFNYKGEVIGMIMGKKSHTTYAAKSTVLLNLIKSLPADQHNVKLSKNNGLNKKSRTLQVKESLDYICSIDVYKK